MKYENQILKFYKESGCIPEGIKGYCYSVENEYAWVCFEYPILGYKNLKIHLNVIKNSAAIVRS